MSRAGLRKIGILLWILGFAVAGAAGAPEDYEGKPIESIVFQPEAQPYARDYLLGILPVKTGQALRLADVRAAIERLHRTNRYASIKVDATSGASGVILTFITTGNFFVGRISVSHVPQPPNESTMVNATRLELGSLYTEANLQQAIGSMEQVLRSNGFYRTRIHPEFDHDPVTQQVAIRFVVDTNDRAQYREPAVTGDPQRPLLEIVKLTRWKGWFGWKKVTDSHTQDGVQRVRRFYQKRDRLESRVALDKMEWDEATNRVKPTLDIDAGPKIQISTTGAKISRGRLKQLVPVFEEQSVDRDLLVEGATNIREYLEGQGFFDAKVEFDTHSSDAKKKDDSAHEVVEYTIVRGMRHKLVKVGVQGNRYFDTETIRERMYVRPASSLQFRYGRFSNSFLRHDMETVEALYRSNGFRDVVVTPKVEQGYGGKSNHMAVYLKVDEGPQTLVAGLTVEGPSEPHREAVLNLIQSQNGQPFSDVNIAIDRDNVLDYYYNLGYTGASFTWNFTPAEEANRVNVRYVIQEGRQRFLREFLISGLETTNRKLVEERLTLEPGAPISRGSLLEAQRRLYDLGVFARADTALQNPQGEEKDKYVLLDLEEARKYTFTTGIGAQIAKIGSCRTCLDQPAGSTGFSPRASFGVTRRNFLGEGHVVSLQTRISTLEQRGVLSYEAPQFRGSSDISLLFSGVYDDANDVRTFSSKRREGAVQVGERISKASTMLYRFSFRRVSVSDLIVSPELIPLYSQPARIGMASVNFVQDRRDEPGDAHRGVFNTVDVGLASKYFGSQADFTHLLAHNATYHAFGFGRRYVLARSFTFGWNQALRAGSNIPLPERFFGGGAQSHRGFPENQAGVRDLETGFPLGGNALLMNQTELRFPVVGENIGAVLFWDAGNVYSRIQAISFRQKQKPESQNGLRDFDYMEHAIGIGLRYRTPVGPVRFDVAYSINPPKFFGFKGTYDTLVQCSSAHPPTTGCIKTTQQISHFQYHFSLGQAF